MVIFSFRLSLIVLFMFTGFDWIKSEEEEKEKNAHSKSQRNEASFQFCLYFIFFIFVFFLLFRMTVAGIVDLAIVHVKKFLVIKMRLSGKHYIR